MTRVAKVAGFGTTLALFAVMGCASDTRPVKPPPVSEPAAPRADTLATPTLAQFNGSIGGAQQQIDATLASLAALTDPAQTDVRGAYDKYCDNLARMQQHAASMKKEADGMRASRDAYFSNWEEKTTEIDNPTIRASAEARRKRLRSAHEQIITASNEAKDAYIPFIKDLEDMKKYLAPDLSKSAVADLGDAAKKVQVSGGVVKEKLGILSKTLESVQGGV